MTDFIARAMALKSQKMVENAINNNYAASFDDYQEAINAIQKYDNTQLEVGNNICVLGASNLQVSSVESTKATYTYESDDKVNEDIANGKSIQIGYYKFIKQPSISVSGGSIPSLEGYAKKEDIPTKTSELTNDSGFITADEVNSTAMEVGDTEPTDPNVQLWLDTSEEDEVGSVSSSPAMEVGDTEPTDPNVQLWLDTSESEDEFNETEEIDKKLETKLDKNTDITALPFTYIKEADGSQSMLALDRSASGDTLVQRESDGRVKVANPVNTTDAVNKAYLGVLDTDIVPKSSTSFLSLGSSSKTFAAAYVSTLRVTNLYPLGSSTSAVIFSAKDTKLYTNLLTQKILPSDNLAYDIGDSSSQYGNIYGKIIYQDNKQVATKEETDVKLNVKADKSTTLAGYGITNAYTKDETDNLINNALATKVLVNLDGEY